MQEIKFIVFMLFLGFVVVTTLYPLFKKQYIESLLIVEAYLLVVCVAVIYFIAPLFKWWMSG